MSGRKFPKDHPKGKKKSGKRGGRDGIPGAPGSTKAIVNAMFPRVQWPRFDSVSAGNFSIHSGRTLSGRKTNIVFFNFKIDRVASGASSNSTGSYSVLPTLFNLNSNTKFTAFSAIWQQVRLLGLRFYFVGLQGKNCPGKIVAWLDYKTNAVSAPTLNTLEKYDTKMQILNDQRLAYVTWGRDDLEDTRFVNAATANYFRPPDASGTNSFDCLYWACDTSSPANTNLFDVYVHAFTEWNEMVV